MQKLVINGGKILQGEVKISGSKNSALPCLVATLLTDEDCVLENVPQLVDVRTICALLEHLGKEIILEKHRIVVKAGKVVRWEAPYELVSRMRASVLVMGPLLARYKKAWVSLPGGCAIGARAIDIHLKGFTALGAKIKVESGYVEAEAGKLIGKQIFLDYPSVGATEVLMMTAVLAEGKTVLKNAACEPEIVDLGNLLGGMGAKISGLGTKQIQIEGGSSLAGIKHRVIPDRIEASTFLLAGAITGGKITLLGANPQDLETVILKLREAGVEVFLENNKITVAGNKQLKATDIETSPYPGFPTDMQAQWMALMAIAKGRSRITETVFENRFMHVGELQRMGADVQIKGNCAVVEGKKDLSGAKVMASDLRASAALVLAALAAEGKTEISRIYHLDRGYEQIEKKLRKLGAIINRVEAD
ncbi:MAG: UDP-N-acetylglucosamine 1-carboxyvinyltransferase [Elusimicrobiota bacterium]